MKEFVEKLIERLKKYQIEYKSGFGSLTDETVFRVMENVIYIVKDLASEHNNGWISVEDALPEETEQHSTKYEPITLAEVDVEWYMISDLVNVIVKNYDTDEVFVCDDCTVDGEWANFGSYPFEVLAWQPMPEIPAPYKKGE